jgi:hypothetical protein
MNESRLAVLDRLAWTVTAAISLVPLVPYALMG